MLVVRGVVIAFLMTLALGMSLRFFDKRSGINFALTWSKLHEHYQVRYLCVRMVCFTTIFIFAFTIA